MYARPPRSRSFFWLSYHGFPTRAPAIAKAGTGWKPVLAAAPWLTFLPPLVILDYDPRPSLRQENVNMHAAPRAVLSPVRAIPFLLALCLSICGAPARAQDAPLLKILDQFTAADVPASGPNEPGPTTRTWWDPT